MYCTIVILCLECFHCYAIIIDCLLTSFDMLYFSTDGCINKSLTYLLTTTGRDCIDTIRVACVLCIFYREMTFGRVDTLGQYVSEFDPEPDSSRKGIGIHHSVVLSLC